MSPPALRGRAAPPSPPVRGIATVAPAALTGIGAIQSGRDALFALAAGVGVLAVMTTLTSRRAVGIPLLAGLSVAAAGAAAACWGNPRNLGWFALCIIAGWAALRTRTAHAVVAGVVLSAVFAVQLIVVSTEPGWITWIAGTTFTTGACIFARRQWALADALRAAQQALAERSRADERQRIARDLHDLLGHALTVTHLHIESARLSLDDDPDRARDSLVEAERAARASLDDLRTAVALLRTPGTSATAPIPAAADIPELAASIRRTGAGVELDVQGDLRRLGATRGLAAYRIVQESLTNAVRHGDGSPIRVSIQVADSGTEIRVNNGFSLRSRKGTGTGLHAMRERAEALGGHVSARPDKGGWQVEAAIPT